MLSDPLADENEAVPVSAILVAAGESTRMGGVKRKPFLIVGGTSILARTLALFDALPEVEEVILVVHPDDLEEVRERSWTVFAAAGATLAVAGGSNRAESVWNGIRVSDPANPLLAVHDAVRPFAGADLCRGLFRMALKRGAAVPVVPVGDTVKRVEGDRIVETPPRLGLMRVQTPQIFRREVLIEANEYALRTGGLSERITDDAALVEAMGGEVAVLLGNPYNLKITTPEDVKLAEALLAAKLV